jgi:hypothetical protein
MTIAASKMWESKATYVVQKAALEIVDQETAAIGAKKMITAAKHLLL